MDKDLLLVLLSEPTAQLALATAGGGKTTLSQVKIILEKIYRKTKLQLSMSLGVLKFLIICTSLNLSISLLNLICYFFLTLLLYRN